MVENKANQAKAGLAAIAGGVKEGIEAKVEEYVQRILDGEPEEDVLSGVPKILAEKVRAKIEEPVDPSEEVIEFGIDEGRGNFWVEDILVFPTAMAPGEHTQENAYRRGIVEGVRKATVRYEGDHKKGGQVIQKIAEIAIDQQLFDKAQLVKVLQDHGIEVKLAN